jgi:bifunctional UDP-N-acetylglucosamine pyrophosphorylase / glucosamine-1-phosphate N-acetyltransferase
LQHPLSSPIKATKSAARIVRFMGQIPFDWVASLKEISSPKTGRIEEIGRIAPSAATSPFSVHVTTDSPLEHLGRSWQDGTRPYARLTSPNQSSRMNQPLAIVLAAGKGTRMKSELPKVLIDVGGRPMIHYVLDALQRSGVRDVIVVVGYRADDVRRELGSRAGLRFVEQTQQLGTGHAVMVCREALDTHEGPVLIVTGDSPLVRPDTLDELLAEFHRLRPACLIGTAHKDNPHGLGRIVRDAAGNFLAIVEEKDATIDQRRLTEVNMSYYVFAAEDLRWALDRIKPSNAQAEYYLTDCPGVLKAAGRPVAALALLRPTETLSINTFEELATVEAALKAIHPR